MLLVHFIGNLGPADLSSLYSCHFPVHTVVLGGLLTGFQISQALPHLQALLHSPCPLSFAPLLSLSLKFTGHSLLRGLFLFELNYHPFPVPCSFPRLFQFSLCQEALPPFVSGAAREATPRSFIHSTKHLSTYYVPGIVWVLQTEP